MHINYLGIAKVYCMFGDILGVSMFGITLNKFKIPKLCSKNANLITVWVGDDALKHSIEHEKIFFYINIIIIIIIKILKILYKKE